jgi:hypothetical protein
MKKHLRIFLIMTAGYLYHHKVSAQTTIVQLPVVGDTIDYNEKEKYFLFQDISNKDYLFSVVSKRNSDTLITHYTNNNVTEIKANWQSVSSILNNINRLDAYYRSMADTTGHQQKDYSMISNPDKIRPEDPNLKPGLQVTPKELKKEYKNGQIYKSFNATPIEKKLEREKIISGMSPR